jgi:Leucine-rich repeat (LRR) protein
MITHCSRRVLSLTCFSLFLLVIILFNLSWLPTVSAATDCTIVTEISQTECQTLIDLYNSTNGPSWSDNATNNWNVTNTPCSWAGITCINAHVIGIDRDDKNLSGSLPDLSSLTALQLLDLSNGQLSGPLPTWLSSLTTLQFLDLNQNQLTGDIPDLSGLTNLQWLWLEENPLNSGIIPEWICNLTLLTSLNFSGSQRTGSISSCINELTNLTELYLNNNQLSEAIPNLGNLTKLTNLDLSYNQLNSSIPISLTNLTNLTELDLGYNRLTATDPILQAFLSTQDPDWAQTQTVLPTNLTATPLSENSIQISWTPILYTSDGGYYWVQYATTPGGPYTPATSATPNKSATSYVVSGLSPNTTYYFVVQTYTPAHDLQQNELTSDLSAEVSATTIDSQLPPAPPLVISPPTTPLALNVITVGQGKIISTPTGIDCASQCQAVFEPNTPITLTAIPDTNWHFEKWQGDCDQNGQVFMDREKQCEAVFVVVDSNTVDAMGDSVTPPSRLIDITGWIPFAPVNLAVSGTPPTIAVPSSDLKEITVNIDVPGMYVTDKVASDGNNYQQLNLPQGGVTTEEGKPQVPMLSQFIAIPIGAQVSVEILESDSDELTGYWVYPAQPPAADLENAPLPPFTLDEEFYTRDEFYPADVVKWEGPQVIRGSSVIILRVFPVQFNPARQTLRVYSKIRLRVTFHGGQNYFIEGQLRSSAFDQIFDSLLLNAKQVFAASSPVIEAAYDEGNSLLIITHPNFLEAANTLAKWKITKGIATTVKMTSEIVTKPLDQETEANQIQSFIQNAYRNWNPPPTYVLLIGDAEFISPYYKTWHPYNDYCGGCEGYIGTDLYYATVDGNDYFPDISLGRLSVDTLAEANRRVNNIIAYERNPVVGNEFYQKVALATYFQDCNYPPCQGGNDGSANRRFAQTVEDIAIYLADPNYLNQYQVDRLYFTENRITPTHWSNALWNFGGGPAGDPGDPLPNYLRRDSGFAWDGDAKDITDAINDGRFLVIHRDHGETWGWVDPQYTTSDVQALTNGNKLPVVWSINCRTGWFDNETDNSSTNNNPLPLYFSEAWERNPNGGAVGVIAATRVSYSGHNDRLIWGLMDAIWPNFVNSYTATGTPFDQPMWEMGAVLNYGKYYYAEHYSESNYRQTTFEIFHWFGDPTMPIWTSEPQPFNNVSHAALISAGTEFIEVDVNVPEALISITRENNANGEILGRKFSTGGITTIPLSKPVSATDTIHVTITKHNYRPYEGTITTDPCSMATVRSNESGNWSSVNTWSRKVGDSWMIGTKPKAKDNVLIQSSHIIEANSVRVEALCIETSGVLTRLKRGTLSIRAKHINNQGEILGVNGTDGYVPDGLEPLAENYLRATNGGNVKLIATETLINGPTGKIKAGRGGDDITHNFFSEQFISARGGKGGNIFIDTQNFINKGIIGPENPPYYDNKQWLSDGGNGGIGSNSYQVAWECLGRKQTGDPVDTDQYLLGTQPGWWNAGNAIGGNGGQTVVNAAKQLINHGWLSSGYGGDARVWQKDGVSCAYRAKAGTGGNNVTTSLSLANYGTIRAGGDGKAISEPEIILAGTNMRYEDSQEVVIFGGDNHQLNLRQLSTNAITATATITIAVGRGGTIDLRENNTAIFNAPNVRIFSDTVLIDDSKQLADLTPPESHIETSPAQILREVALSSSGTFISTPITNQTIEIEILNASPTAETYILTVDDPQKWSINSLPTTVTVNGLETMELSLHVILPATTGAENTITITATSQSDPNAMTTTETTLAVVSEAELPPEPEELEAMVISDPSKINPCLNQGVVNRVCNIQEQVITDLVVEPNASIANGTVTGTLINNGLVSNLTIEPTGLLIGGTVSGSIRNQGQMMDFNFVGAEIQGGTLGGTLNNNSSIGGTFKDVHFAPNTYLTGGRLQGNLSGDAKAPALLENLTVTAASQIAYVNIGENVILAEGVTLGEGVEFINPADDPRNLKPVEVVPPPTCNTNLPLLGTTAVDLLQNELVVGTMTQINGGISVNQAAFQPQVAQKRSASVTVKGQLCPDLEHIGQAAELIVYVEYRPLNSPESQPYYYMLDDQGQVLLWDSDFKNLVTFQKMILKATQPILIYQDKFPVSGWLNIYFGYRLPTSGLLVFNHDAIIAEIVE